MASSSTTTTSSRRSRRIADVSSAGYLTAIPSAIVGPVGASPAKGAQAAAWTPTSESSGRSARNAIATPEARPPPPTGITTVPGPAGSCSASSRPSVPCPAITRGSSNAWTKVAPVASTWARAVATASSKPSPPERDGGAVPSGGIHLGHRRAFGDEDRRCDPGLARRPRDGLPVVAGTRGRRRRPVAPIRSAARSCCMRPGS